MENHSKFIIKRKTEKIGFQMFMLNVRNNHFDKISDEAITKHENEIIRLSKLDEKKLLKIQNIYGILFFLKKS